MSRGWIRILAFRCPEVGLEFSLDAPPTKELDRKKSGLGDLTVRAGDRGGGSTLRAKEASRKRSAEPQQLKVRCIEYLLYIIRVRGKS